MCAFKIVIKPVLFQQNHNVIWSLICILRKNLKGTMIRPNFIVHTRYFVYCIEYTQAAEQVPNTLEDHSTTTWDVQYFRLMAIWQDGGRFWGLFAVIRNCRNSIEWDAPLHFRDRWILPLVGVTRNFFRSCTKMRKPSILQIFGSSELKKKLIYFALGAKMKILVIFLYCCL